jgi:hypothetical protein
MHHDITDGASKGKRRNVELRVAIGSGRFRSCAAAQIRLDPDECFVAKGGVRADCSLMARRRRATAERQKLKRSSRYPRDGLSI